MKPLKLKSGVKINGKHFDPEIVAILNAVRASAPETQDGTIWVTSANDSTHKKGSKHYTNEAFDIRTKILGIFEHSYNPDTGEVIDATGISTPDLTDALRQGWIQQ